MNTKTLRMQRARRRRLKKGHLVKVELRINGKFHLELTPETSTETLVLTEMLSRAAKGKTVTLTQVSGTWPADVSVEQ